MKWWPLTAKKTKSSKSGGSTAKAWTVWMRFNWSTKLYRSNMTIWPKLWLFWTLSSISEYSRGITVESKRKNLHKKNCLSLLRQLSFLRRIRFQRKRRLPKRLSQKMISIMKILIWRRLKKIKRRLRKSQAKKRLSWRSKPSKLRLLLLKFKKHHKLLRVKLSHLLQSWLKSPQSTAKSSMKASLLRNQLKNKMLIWTNIFQEPWTLEIRFMSTSRQLIKSINTLISFLKKLSCQIASSKS